MSSTLFVSHKRRGWLYFLIIAVLIFVFYFAWPPLTSHAPTEVEDNDLSFENDSDFLEDSDGDYTYSQITQDMLSRVPGLECLEFGHNVVEKHIHATLELYVDNARKLIPADIGITDDCMSELHTHADSGKVHIETVGIDKTFTLKNFFDLWQKPLVFPDYRLEVTLNSDSLEEYNSYVFKDDDVIVLRYTKDK